MLQWCEGVGRLAVWGDGGQRQQGTRMGALLDCVAAWQRGGLEWVGCSPDPIPDRARQDGLCGNGVYMFAWVCSCSGLRPASTARTVAVTGRVRGACWHARKRSGIAVLHGGERLGGFAVMHALDQLLTKC